MRILLIGEASFVHNNLKKGLAERGHSVTLMSDGNAWHNSPRDIDLRRDMRLGKLGGLKVLWQLLRHLRSLVGNDVVQIHNYQFVPLKMRWNELLLDFLKRHNRCVVKGCYGDDPQVLRRQAEGVPRYSDTFWNGRPQNTAENAARTAEQLRPDFVRCWLRSSVKADALVACLYEYYLCYDAEPFREKLHYIPLPVVMPGEEPEVKGRGGRIKVLVGIQSDRDYLKGARRIAALLDEIDRREPGRLDIRRVENVPYADYCRMLAEADVLVDQLYSMTPSMNSLAAMARGTVVIGGGEEDFYRFIGEKELRPIINVTPELSDEENIKIIRDALLTDGSIARLSRQSVAFVRKYHDYRKVAAEYEEKYFKGKRVKK